jgi:hypothetical protein
MAKLKCDNPDCDYCGKPLARIEIQLTFEADYNEKEERYTWSKDDVDSAQSEECCPYCGKPLQ